MSEAAHPVREGVIEERQIERTSAVMRHGKNRAAGLPVFPTTYGCLKSSRGRNC
jgi:hypothetical protein